jgi:hypothetical protein
VGGMGGWVVWVRWAPHRFSGWYVGPGLFAAVLLTFLFVSRMHLAQQYRGNGHFLSAASFSRRETLVGGTLVRASALRVGLGVSGAAVASGSSARPSHSCDGWVCVLGIWVRCRARY